MRIIIIMIMMCRYLKRYTMPKMLVAATGDEFFPLDSERQ